MAWNCWGYYMYIKSILRAFKSLMYLMYIEKKNGQTLILGL